MRIFYLGDIHGNFSVIHQYVKMYDIKDAHIIQVGDFGVGFATFEKEKRMLEMIRTGIASKEKKATKLARSKLGTHRRALLKRNEMNNLIQ